MCRLWSSEARCLCFWGTRLLDCCRRPQRRQKTGLGDLYHRPDQQLEPDRHAGKWRRNLWGSHSLPGRVDPKSQCVCPGGNWRPPWIRPDTSSEVKRDLQLSQTVLLGLSSARRCKSYAGLVGADFFVWRSPKKLGMQVVSPLPGRLLDFDWTRVSFCIGVVSDSSHLPGYL
jgi:hypothetical protein